MLVGLPLAILTAAIFFRYVEKPFMNTSKKTSLPSIALQNR